MSFTPRFSTGFTSQKLRAIFLGARFGRIPRCENCQSDRIYKVHDTTLPESDVRLFELFESEDSSEFFEPEGSSEPERPERPEGFSEPEWPEDSVPSTVKSSGLNSSFDCEVFRTEQPRESSTTYRCRHCWSQFRLQGLAKRGRGSKVRKHRKVFSDTHTGYQGLVALGSMHRTVNHGDEEYVNGNVHINGINGMEGFWGLSKTNMQTYKGIRKKSWNEYLKEMEFRYNERSLSFEELTVKIIGLLCKKRRKLV